MRLVASAVRREKRRLVAGARLIAVCVFSVAVVLFGTYLFMKPTPYDFDPAVWTSAPTWAALNFNPGQDHYYAYAYRSRGTGVDSVFFASAYGDLDDDGELSTFGRFGCVVTCCHTRSCCVDLANDPLLKRGLIQWRPLE